MKNYVKTLEGSQFEVEVDAEDTVADVKKHIETVQGADVYPSVQQMLIHQGKVLKDSTKLSENNVIENSFLVIMLSKPKASSGPSTTTAAPTSQVESPNPPPANPTPQVTSASSVSPIVSSPPAPVSSAPATPTSLVTGSSEQDVYGEAASNLVSGSSLEETIQNILDIGGGTWDRDTVVRALRAAFNNPERAIEYLYSGIPEPAEVPIVERPPPNVQAGNPPAAQAPPTTVTSSGPNANPLDLFPQGLPSSGQNPGAGTLDFLRNSPQFQALRAMVQANPQILQPMLQELGRQNPQLMRLIQEHQPDFLSLINEPVEGGAEGNLFGDAAAMPQAITVTPEEREAIERILMVLCIGGAERLIVDAAVELASHGHAVHIFTAHHDRTRCFEETIGGPFPVTIYGGFLPRHIFYRFHADFAYLRCIFVALCVLLLWPSFDIVVADQVSVIIPLVKLKKSTKVVFYCHFPDLLLAQRSNALRRLYRKPIDMIEEATTGMADLVVVNSRFTASTFAKTFRHLNARGIQPDVLYPAVAIEQFEEPSAYKLNFLSANRFERKKNIGLAISAFSLLQKDGLLGDMVAGVTLTLAGGFDKRLKENVEYLEELKALAEQEGVSNRVAFTTSCSTAERNQLLSECICVVYTPKDEHFGIVPLEAMAAQKPVIACNSSGPLETINHGVTGFLCKPTSHDFSQALAKLIRNPELAERMGREAREHVCRYFSTKVFGQRLNSIVLDVCHRRQE